MKKSLIIVIAILSILNILIMCTVATSAEGDISVASDTTNVFKVGDTYYSSLSSAVSKASSGDTIEMLQNYSIPSMITINKDIVIVGNNNTLMCADSVKYLFKIDGGANIKIKDITLNAVGGFAMLNGAVTAENATVTLSARPFVAAASTSATNMTVNIINSNISINHSESYQEPLISLTGKTKNVLNISGASVLTKYSQVKSTASGSSAVIYSSSVGTTDISISENSKIVLAQKENGSGPAFGIYLLGKGNKNITLANGSSMHVESIAPELYYIYTEGNTVTTDNGCTFSITKEAIATSNIYVPELVMENSKFLGFYFNGNFYKSGMKIDAAAIEDDEIFFDSVFFDSSKDLVIANGASLRKANGTGIRFATTVSERFKELSGDNLKFGILIGNTVNISNDIFTLDESNTNENIVYVYQSKWGGEESTTFYAAMINIPNTAKAYKLMLSARGFMKITYADGSSEVYYTDIVERSLYEIACKYKENGDTCEYVQLIIDKVSEASVGLS